MTTISGRGVRVKTRTGVVGTLLALVLVFGAIDAARALDGCRVTGGGTVDACGPGASGCDPSTPGSCAPGVLGSQPEAPGPHASTVPPPVTRQPSNARAASIAPNTSTSARRVPTTPVRVFTRTPRPLIVVIGSPVVEASQCAVWPLRTSEGGDRMF